MKKFLNVLVLLLVLGTSTFSSGQSVSDNLEGRIDALDPRIVFDPKNRDATRIPAIINRIELEERATDVQLSDLDRRRSDLSNLMSQFRNLNLPKLSAVAFPERLKDLGTAASSTEARLQLLRDNLALLRTLKTQTQPREAAIENLKELIPSARISSNSTVSRSDQQFRINLSNRLSKLIDSAGTSRCNLDDIITVLSKSKEDPKRFSTVDFNSDEEIVSEVQKCAESYKTVLNLDELRNSMIKDLEAINTELDSRLKNTRNYLASILDAKTKWQNQLRRATEISNSLIDWTIPLLAISVVALLGIPALYRGEVQQILISNGIILEVFTVFLLITTVLLLGIADRIQSEALGTLLGGISGYVLGRNMRQGRTPEIDSAEKSPPRPKLGG